jgi:hypothetical protein
LGWVIIESGATFLLITLALIRGGLAESPGRSPGRCLVLNESAGSMQCSDLCRNLQVFVYFIFRDPVVSTLSFNSVEGLRMNPAF